MLTTTQRPEPAQATPALPSAAAAATRPANRLIREKSPYLLQHAHNPVDWYPWGEEAFGKARKENRPIFLSIGYSTCHWCHVMEHESFENSGIAEALNTRFICVKVDREERPDVDQVYMSFVQATTGGGGWPMSVWLTPDLKPFFGGTYYPPQQLADISERIADAWTSNPAPLIAQAEHVVEVLRKVSRTSTTAQDQPRRAFREKAFLQLASAFDGKRGGFSPAPKFPRPAIFNFLFRFFADEPEGKKSQRALEMTLFTLRQMAAGGIHDVLGGGFHRYSVDPFWHVPHFEKMLYDQAQLASAFLTAFQVTREPLFEKTARDILDYVRRDMTDPAGGFYSAEDADSLIAEGAPERAEGAFYVWTAAEIERVLGPEQAKIFDYRFGVETGGNVPSGSDHQGEFTGRNILIQRHSMAETAKTFGLTEEQVEARLAASRQRLFEAREKRPRPQRDDKILTAWNGLMISAFSRAANVLDDSGYRAAATSAALSVRKRLYRESDQTLLRSYRDGASAVEGFADDYAFLIQGLLDLYEATFDPSWIEWAMELQRRQDELFWDDEAGGYFGTTGKEAGILLRSKTDYDGAEPSPNSVAALNLMRLAHMLDRNEWRTRAERTLRAFSPQFEKSPTALPQMLAALSWWLSAPVRIIIAGNPDASDTHALLREVNRRFIPNKIVILADGGRGQTFFAGAVDWIKDVAPIGGQAAAYVCENFVCQRPVTQPDVLAQVLSGRPPHVSSTGGRVED